VRLLPARVISAYSAPNQALHLRGAPSLEKPHSPPQAKRQTGWAHYKRQTHRQIRRTIGPIAQLLLSKARKAWARRVHGSPMVGGLSEARLLPWCGWCRQSTTAPPLCPQHCGPFTAAQVVLDQIDLPTSCPSLSPPSPMMRRTHSIITMLARLARVRH
jgi:hypothetical protein